MKTIGFIGLGTMGKPMAANLLRKGYAVIVYNRSAGKADELVQLGAEAVSSAAAAAAVADTVIMMLSTDQVVLDLFYRTGGIRESLHEGTVLIDCSTVSPETSRKIAADAQANGAHFLDAPVTGSLPSAIDGTLTFMVGGSSSVLEQQKPILLAMGNNIVHMGSVGAGSQTKIAHNAIVALNNAALCEGVSLAAKAGIDPEKFLQVVRTRGANSAMAEMKGPKIVGRDFSKQFSLELMHKDLKLASALASKLDVTTPLLEVARGLYRTGLSKGLGDEDLCALIQCYEQWMDHSVAPVPQQAEAAADTGNSSATAGSERRRSVRVPMNIHLKLSVYQWEQEGAFSGHHVEGTLYDLSESGLQVASTFPLAKDMFVVIHFPQEAGLPPIIGKIIRIDSKDGLFRYGCMLSGIPPHVQLRLEEYVELKTVEPS